MTLTQWKADTMKVILFNGSTRKNGCTFAALSEVAKALRAEGVETETLQMGDEPVRDCIGCNGCLGKGRCVFDDDVANRWLEKAWVADGFVFGSPVYFSHPTGQFLSILDRMFYAGKDAFTHKPGAAIVSARRAGTTASLDVLQKYCAIAQMPVSSSIYWNMVHGTDPKQVAQDLEGLQIMRGVGRNLAWLLKCIAAGRAAGMEPPRAEELVSTNFIR